jgi:hypothetical protein
MRPEHALSSDVTPADGIVRLYGAGWRLVAGALVAVSRANLVGMVLAMVLVPAPLEPAAFFRTIVLFSLLPALGAWIVGRALRGELRFTDGAVVLTRPGLRADVPATAVARVAPWRVPLPGPGFSIVTASGRRLRPGVQADDPRGALRALAERGGIDVAEAALAHPAVVYAGARADAGRSRWYHVAVKFPVFALAPTAVLFNAHQHIAYGGALGEYYLLGLGAYLETFAIYWAATTVYCILGASIWRGPAEGVCLLAAHVAPSRAAKVRRAAELTCRAAYYGGVPILLALRFAPW